MTDVPLLHLDMDAFFAAVEILERPQLAQRPVIIGGTGPRAVVASANYPARVYGVRSAMPVARALQLCPHAVIIPPSHGKYSVVSKQVMQILQRFTPLVEALSIDEAFLDVSGAHKLFGSTEQITERLRAEILAETGLTASIGGAAVKFVAKIASAAAKPDGVLLIPADRTLEFLHPLPVGKLWGVGRKTNEVLHNMAIRTIGELAVTPYPVLRTRLGEALAGHLLNLANGIDPRPVTPGRDAKSISNEHTYEYDVRDLTELKKTLLMQAEKVGQRARAAGLKGRTISLKFRTADFKTLSRSLTIEQPTNVTQKLYQVALDLLDTLWAGQPVRLIGLRLDQFDDTERDLLLWEDEDAEDWADLDEVLDKAKQRFGQQIIRPATLMKPQNSNPEDTNH